MPIPLFSASAHDQDYLYSIKTTMNTRMKRLNAAVPSSLEIGTRLNELEHTNLFRILLGFRLLKLLNTKLLSKRLCKFSNTCFVCYRN